MFVESQTAGCDQLLAAFEFGFAALQKCRQFLLLLFKAFGGVVLY